MSQFKIKFHYLLLTYYFLLFSITSYGNLTNGQIYFCEKYGITECNEGNIKTTYKKEALKNHPDKNPNNIEEATKNMQEINNDKDIADGKMPPPRKPRLKNGEEAGPKTGESSSNSGAKSGSEAGGETGPKAGESSSNSGAKSGSEAGGETGPKVGESSSNSGAKSGSEAGKEETGGRAMACLQAGIFTIQVGIRRWDAVQMAKSKRLACEAVRNYVHSVNHLVLQRSRDSNQPSINQKSDLIDYFTLCEPSQENCKGMRLDYLENSSSPLEAQAIRNAGGAHALLSKLNINTADYVAKFTTEGAAAALASTLPLKAKKYSISIAKIIAAAEEEGPKVAQLFKINSTLRRQSDQAKMAKKLDLDKKVDQNINTEMTNKCSSFQLCTTKNTDNIKQNSLSELLNNQNNLDNSDISDDIWHSNSKMSIFAIISKKLNRIHDRVETLEWATPLNRAINGLPQK